MRSLRLKYSLHVCGTLFFFLQLSQAVFANETISCGSGLSQTSDSVSSQAQILGDAEAAGLGSCTYELGYENIDGTGYLSMGSFTPSDNRWTKKVSFVVPGPYNMVLRLTCPSPSAAISVKRPFAVAISVLAVSPTPVPAGGSVAATWADIATPTATDWLGLYPSPGAANSPPIAWRYTNGLAGSNVPFNIPPGASSGSTYELRVFTNNGYTRLATSGSFTVQ